MERERGEEEEAGGDSDGVERKQGAAGGRGGGVWHCRCPCSDPLQPRLLYL